MSLGFSVVGKLTGLFRLVGGLDIEPDAALSYHANFGVPAILKDVRQIASNSSELEAFLSSLDNWSPRQPTVLIGCAPCQGFSAHRKKNWDVVDERNDLIATFASIAVKVSPECVVMENVPELLSARNYKIYLSAKDQLERAGYIVRQSIYNCAEFRVPQERHRTLVIAMKRDFELPVSIITDPALFETVRDAIGWLPSVPAGEELPDDPLHRSAAHKKTTLATIRSIPKDGGSRPPGVGPACLDRVKGFYDVYGRLAWDQPSITITRYSRNPASGRFVHPEQDRGLTMREAALLQSFPVAFRFEGSLDSVFKQIGEAVPPRFSCAVAANVATELRAEVPSSDHCDGYPEITEPVSDSYSSTIIRSKISRRSQ